MIKEAIRVLSKGADLNQGLMRAAMEEIMTGKAQTDEIITFLTALSAKGETVDELSAAVYVMRQHATKIHTKHRIILDTCGTGGDAKGTFNISTCVAFVACGCGITVAKHGNRSVSSRCGSADTLEALGIDLNIGKERIEKCLDEIGIAFLFAPNFHPATRYAMPARKQIGRRTMFNLLGPLSNPAQATHQLVGVFDRRWTEIIAQVLGNLGAVHVLVVHGEDGLDEITTTADTYVTEARDSRFKSYRINPQEFGFEKATLADLSGGDASYNAKVLTDILHGKSGPKRDVVILNAAAAVYTADKASSVKEAIAMAMDSIDSGKAREKFELLKEYSQKR